jgi:hypothetical protein
VLFILDKINDIFTEITKISEYNKKIYFSYFKMNVDIQVSSLEELGDLLESRFHLLCPHKFLVGIKIYQSIRDEGVHFIV